MIGNQHGSRSAQAIKNFMVADASPVSKSAEDEDALKRATRAADEAIQGKLPAK